MILLIGKEGCNRCLMTKNILTNKGVDFKYVYLDNLSQEEQNKYINLATEKNMIELPLIVKDNDIVTLEQII